MGKTYIDTVKYLIYTNVDIGGLVDKPDVVGAIFGQTEGLLGDELDLRDLQKNGRIGRIEVELNGRDGRSIGTIKIPSSLDMVETCIVAAALETVDRIGPCEARLKVMKIEDTRNLKRKVLIDRAKLLLKNMFVDEIPESKEITDMVRDEVKMAEITEFGPDKLSAGPGIGKSNEIIIVEGRADVVNMLKNDMTNVIAIGGAKVPKTVVELSKKKEVTAFLDGDRGGDIILNELVQGGVEIEFTARAPAGKEVEELTRKELIKCIRGKIPFDESAFLGGKQVNAPRRYEEYREPRRFEQKPEPQFSSAPKPEPQFSAPPKPEPIEEKKPVFVPKAVMAPRFEPEQKKVEAQTTNRQFKQAYSEKPKPETPVLQKPHIEEPKPIVPEQKASVSRPITKPLGTPTTKPVEAIKIPELSKKQEQVIDKVFLLKELEGLNNTLTARFYDWKHDRMSEMKVRDVIKSLETGSNIASIVFDGIITQRLVDLASNKGVKAIVGVKVGNVSKRPEGIEIVTK